MRNLLRCIMGSWSESKQETQQLDVAHMKQRVLTYFHKEMMEDKHWLGYTFVETKVIKESEVPEGMFDWIVARVKELGFSYTIREHEDRVLESNIGAK